MLSAFFQKDLKSARFFQKTRNLIDMKTHQAMMNSFVKYPLSPSHLSQLYLWDNDRFHGCSVFRLFPERFRDLREGVLPTYERFYVENAFLY